MSDASTSSSPGATTRRAGGDRGGGGEDRGRSAGGKASSDTSRVDAGAETSAAIAQGRCPDCFGCGEPCAACVAAAGDPSPGEFQLGPVVEQVRRCACGRVYGSYHAGRALCFVMQAPGRREVERCVRCGQRLTAGTTSECTNLLQDAAATCEDDWGGGGEDGSSPGGRASGDTSLTPGERVCQRAGCARPIPDGSRPEARYCSKRCRQAVSRARVRARGPVTRSEPRERCAWCEGPIPEGRRGEAVFCSKRCRQTSSRFGLRSPAPSGTTPTSDPSAAAAARAEPDTSPPRVGAELGATRRAAGRRRPGGRRHVAESAA